MSERGGALVLDIEPYSVSNSLSREVSLTNTKLNTKATKASPHITAQIIFSEST